MKHVVDPMETLEAQLLESNCKQTHSIMVNERVKFNMLGQTALQIVQLAIAANRQQNVLLDPSEVAKYGCDTAQAIFDEARRRGWLLDMPTIDDLFSDDQTKVGF